MYTNEITDQKELKFNSSIEVPVGNLSDIKNPNFEKGDQSTMDINSIYFDDLEKGPEGDIVSPDVGTQNFRINDQARQVEDVINLKEQRVCSTRLKVTVVSVVICFFLFCLTIGAVALTTSILVNI